jgi:hypothetical protein
MNVDGATVEVSKRKERKAIEGRLRQGDAHTINAACLMTTVWAKPNAYKCCC